MSEPVLVAKDLHKRYGNVKALDGVSFSLDPGTITAVLGPNGAGKTTTFRCILGVTPFEGQVLVDGYSSLRQGKSARSRIGYLPQTPAFSDGDSCRQALEFLADLRGVMKDTVEALLERVDLLDQIDTNVAHLSGGMRQRLALAAALISDPPVLLLDEPTANLDAASRGQLLEQVTQLRDEGRTVLISTHFLDSLSDLADRALVLRRGKVLFDGTAEELLSRAPSKRFTVHLNGTSPSAVVEALTAIGVKEESIEHKGTDWEELLALLTEAEEAGTEQGR